MKRLLLGLTPGQVDERARGLIITNRPLAGPGLDSYRCAGRYGWIMIGAMDPQEAISEARRSDPSAKMDALELWDGEQYVRVDHQPRHQIGGTAATPQASSATAKRLRHAR